MGVTEFTARPAFSTLEVGWLLLYDRREILEPRRQAVLYIYRISNIPIPELQ